MAVQEISGVRHYIGAHDDTKPSGVPPGSIFWAVSDDNPPVATAWIYDGAEWAIKAQSTETLDA